MLVSCLWPVGRKHGPHEVCGGSFRATAATGYKTDRPDGQIPVCTAHADKARRWGFEVRMRPAAEQQAEDDERADSAVAERAAQAGVGGARLRVGPAGRLMTGGQDEREVPGADGWCPSAVHAVPERSTVRGVVSNRLVPVHDGPAVYCVGCAYTMSAAGLFRAVRDDE